MTETNEQDGRKEVLALIRDIYENVDDWEEACTDGYFIHLTKTISDSTKLRLLFAMPASNIVHATKCDGAYISIGTPSLLYPLLLRHALELNETENSILYKAVLKRKEKLEEKRILLQEERDKDILIYLQTLGYR